MVYANAYYKKKILSLSLSLFVSLGILMAPLHPGGWAS